MSLVWREATEALTWMRGHPVILQLALMLLVMNGLGVLCTTVLVLFAQEVLGLNVTQYGVLLLSGAAGGDWWFALSKAG